MRLLADVWQDFRFALRLIRRGPGFAMLAVLTLAFGIGATTAVYTVVRAVLLRPLPFQDPSRLVIIWDNAARDGDQVRQTVPHLVDFEEYKRSARSVEHIAGSGRTRSLLTYGGVTRRVPVAIATPALFHETLGVEAALGRTFTAEDEKSGCSVMLAHAFWTTVLGADRSLIGRNLTLDATECAVVGVLPSGFGLWPAEANVWFLKDHASRPANPDDGMIMFARLAAGATIERVRAELTVLHRPLHANDRAAEDDERSQTPAVDHIQGELAYLSAPTLSTSLWLALGAVLLMLLIACLNVANLLLARLSERQRELVVRAALGSGRVRLIRQVLTENLLLAVSGSALGVAIAVAGVRWFRYLNPVELPTYVNKVTVDLPVLVFTILISLATTVVFGLLPATQASRIDLSQSLKAAGRGFFGLASRRRTAQTMVAVQIAVSFVLLIGAGVLMTSALSLGSERLGFDSDRVIALQVTLPMKRYSNRELRNRFYSELLERIDRIPGVQSSALGSSPPFDPHSNIGTEQIEIRGQPSPAGPPVVDVENGYASPASFDVQRTPLLRGRLFDARDRDGAPLVAIVNQKLADEYLPGLDPIGHQVRYATGENRSPWMTIVGVVGTWKHMVNDAVWRDTPMVFQSMFQLREGDGTNFGITVRAASDLTSLGREIQKQVAALDSSAEVKEPELLADRLSKALLYPRFRAELLVCFGLGALLLAAVGLHGVLSQLVSQRIPEFGVRRAVGAQTFDLLLLVARQGGIPVLAGLAVGLASALALSRLLASMLYGIQPADPRLLTAVSIALLVVAALAIAMPARRALRADPMVALRDE
jgi:predicted permease